MSVYYYAACEKCKESIGAHSQASGRLMSEPGELAEFIIKHGECRGVDFIRSLRFADEHEMDEWDNGGRVAKIRTQGVV